MDRRVGLTCVLLAACAAAGCAGRLAGPQSVPASHGVLYLYLEALPDEAAGLHAEISALDALDAEGTARPLALRLSALDGAGPRGQRLLASGPLPAGSYRGLAVTVASARLAGAHGPSELQLPEEPAASECAFSIEAGRATVLSARLQAGASLVGGVRFQPLLTAAPPGALAPGLRAAATIGRDATLAIFHKLAGEVFAVLRTGPGPSSVALDPRRELAFVASADGDALEVYDLVKLALDQRFPVLAGDQPSAVALSADGATLACVHAGSNVLGIYDTPVLAERFRVPVGLEPSMVLLDGDGRHAFVINGGSDTLTVVDLVEGTAGRTVATDDGPTFAAFDRSGRRLYVIHRVSPYLTVFELPRLAVERRVYVGPEASAIAVDRRTDRVFLARRGTGRIEVFDPASLFPVDSIATAGDVSFLAVSPEGDQLYAALPRTREILSVRIAGSRVVTATDVGQDPGWIAVAGER
jgi:DNA-binding beta-propeller fold protein YncE